MVAAQQNITYQRELVAGDIVEVGSALLEIRDRSIRFRHEMRNAETGEIAAVCEFTGVHMGPADSQIQSLCRYHPKDRGKTTGFPEPAEA